MRMNDMPHLPDDIIRHIFSYLTLELIIQTSILCTRFRNPWPSIPSLVLDKYDYCLDLKRWPKVVKGVCASIQKHGDSIHLQKFTFKLDSSATSGLRDAYNELLSLAFSLRVQEIHIDIPQSANISVDFLPKECSVALAGSLTTLKLRKGAMETLPSFLSGCPRLENIDASSHCITKDVTLTFASRKLKTLKLGGEYTRAMVVEIMAPNLELLHYHVKGGSCELLPIDTCKSLKELKICQGGLPDGWLERCIPKLNALQVLKLYMPPAKQFSRHQISHAMIRSDTLIELHLSRCDKLFVDAPKLQYVKIKYLEHHVDFTACPNLHKLVLHVFKVDSLELYLSKFPDIQHLKLSVPPIEGFPKIQNICIRHAQLKTLDLLRAKDMLVELDTPNLQTFTT